MIHLIAGVITFALIRVKWAVIIEHLEAGSMASVCCNIPKENHQLVPQVERWKVFLLKYLPSFDDTNLDKMHRQ